MAEDNIEGTIKKYLSNKSELIKQHREYKKLLDTKLQNRKESVIQRSDLNNLEVLRREKKELKTLLYVTTAPTHLKEIQHSINLLDCHVICQEKLSKDNEMLRNQIQCLEKQNRVLDKTIYDLRRRTMGDRQYSAYVLKASKTVQILENQLEVSKLTESKYFTENKTLRNVLIDMLHHRALFNRFWLQMIGRLSSDQKYLVDIVEYAISTFDSAIDIYQKFNAIRSKQAREMDLRKLEMQNLLQKMILNQNNHEFLLMKARDPELDDLEPREYKRRDIVRNLHRRKISLYSKVIEKVLSSSGVKVVSQAIEKFQRHESLYYSYFNYANELTYKMTNLNNRINVLYKIIGGLRETNLSRLAFQMKSIAKLKRELNDEKKKTNLKLTETSSKETGLRSLYQGIYDIFILSNCDKTYMKSLLGDHSKIMIFNIKQFLLVLEKRLNEIIACVLYTQRNKQPPKTVRDISRRFSEPTPIENIILVQQCPECAEGEDVNPYDTQYVEPFTTSIVKQKVKEKVLQPEMQYRLHSLSKCRLPRSRLLAAKKF